MEWVNSKANWKVSSSLMPNFYHFWWFFKVNEAQHKVLLKFENSSKMIVKIWLPKDEEKPFCSNCLQLIFLLLIPGIQVALTLHGFTLHGSHFTRGLGFCQMNSHYVILYTFSSLYTVKNIISVVLVVLSYCVSPYTNFSLHDLFRKTKIV